MDKAPDAFRTISEVAQELDLPQHVLRFWETRFAQIKPMKRGGGRRYYRPDDVDLLRGIRYLLYGEGYTIRGVQRLLKENGGRFVQSVWQSGAPQPAPLDDEEAADDEAADEAYSALPPVATLAPYQASPAERIQSALMRRATPVPLQPDVATVPDTVVVRANGDALGADAHATDAEGAVLDESDDDPNRFADGPARLSRDDVRKLQATLFELGECRRLLDAALKDEL